MNAEALDFYKKAIAAIYASNSDVAEFCLLKSIEVDAHEMNYACLAWLYAVVMGEEKKALFYFRCAIFSNPKNGELYNDYGALLLRMNRHQEASRWFAKSLRLSPPSKKHLALYNLALVYSKKQQKEKSLVFLRKALEYCPDFQAAHKLYYDILHDKSFSAGMG